MPIHRIGALDRGAVYAFETEIRDWLVVWCRRSHGVERVGPDVPAPAADADRSPWLTRAISHGASSPRLMAGLLGVLGACLRFLRMRSPAAW